MEPSLICVNPIGYPPHLINHRYFCPQIQMGEPSQLHIKDATMDLGGEYMCTATTTIDEVTASAMVTIRGRPGAPAGISVVVSELTANISWSRGLDNNSPILSYSVEGSTNHMADWTILRNGNYASDLNFQTPRKLFFRSCLYWLSLHSCNMYELGFAQD